MHEGGRGGGRGSGRGRGTALEREGDRKLLTILVQVRKDFILFLTILFLTILFFVFFLLEILFIVLR